MLLGTFAALAILEIGLRLLPVGNAVLLAEVAPDPAVKRYRPGSEIQWSSGWNFAYQTRKRVDALGYLNDQPLPMGSSACSLQLVRGNPRKRSRSPLGWGFIKRL